MLELSLFEQPIPQTVTALTFNQAMRLFKHIHWSNTRMGRKTDALTGHMVNFFDGQLYHSIGRQGIIGMRRHLEELGHGLSYINKAHRIYKIMANKFEEWHSDGFAGGYDFRSMVLPRKNPATMVRIPKDPARDRFITPWEYRVLIRLAKRLNDWDLVDIINMGVWCRLSPIDLEHLNDSEIDEEQWQISVRRRHTITPLNPEGELQIIPLREKIWGLIDRRRRYRRPGDKAILNFKNMRRRVGRLRKLAVEEGLRDFTLMDFRKAAPGELWRHGYSVHDIAQGLGNTERVAREHYIPKTRPHLIPQTDKVLEIFK